jgi:hypothetical protein
VVVEVRRAEVHEDVDDKVSAARQTLKDTVSRYNSTIDTACLALELLHTVQTRGLAMGVSKQGATGRMGGGGGEGGCLRAEECGVLEVSGAVVAA